MVGGVIIAVFDVCVYLLCPASIPSSSESVFWLNNAHSCGLQLCAEAFHLEDVFVPPKEEVKWEVISLKKRPSEDLLIKNTTPVAFSSERWRAKRVGKDRKRTEDIRYSHIS